MVNYFMFNKSEINELYLVTNITRVLLPKKKIETLDIASRDGEVFNGSKYAPIEYDITILISGDDEADLKRKIRDLKNLLYSKVPVEVRLFDETKFSYGIISDDIELTPKSALDVLAKAHLICHMPFFYSIDLKVTDNKENKVLVNIENTGDVETKPFFTNVFSSNANFLQLQNQITKQTLLVGDYPSLELESKDPYSTALNDPCTTTSNWVSSTVPIDSNRSGGGTLAVTNENSGLCIGTLPSSSSTDSNVWKGVQVRRNLTAPLEDFKVEAYLTMKSTGVNGDPTVIPVDEDRVTVGGTKTIYEVKTKTLNCRKGPGSSYLCVHTLKKGYQIVNYEIVNGWLKFSDSDINNGATMYCNKSYTKAKTISTTITTTKRNVVVKQPTSIRASYTSDATSLVIVPKNGVVRVISSKTYSSKDSDGVVRTYYKLAEPYKGYDGYICIGNLYDLTDEPVITITYDTPLETADDKTGVIELYGMGVNGERIFKFEMCDDQQYFEYNCPKVYVGLKCEYQDETKVRKPNNYTTTNNNEVKVTNYMSGVLGSWNDFYGKISISRVKDSAGNHVWTVSINKLYQGNIIANKKFTKTINNTATENLSYFILYMGTYGNIDKCTSMALNSLKVQGISKVDTTVNNKVEFRAGDVIDIDFENRNVYLNQELRNDLVDIGSYFFDIEKGINPIKIFTNDTNIYSCGIIQEKWIGAE